jgi:dienelactone hydrolase
MNKNFTFIVAGHQNKPMPVDVFLPENVEGSPLLVVAHGFKGFKDWGHFPLSARYFADKGFTTVTFNFSHNGTTLEHLTDFADLEAFGNNNYSIELADMRTILDVVITHDFIKEKGVNTDALYLLGHSRGGGIATLTAANDQRIKKLVTWASVVAFAAFFGDDIVEHWKQEGVIYSPNARTGQQMPLYFQLYKDVVQNKTEQDIRNAATSVKIPWLIVHGTADKTVPISVAHELKSLNEKAILLEIEEGDHNFGARHPLPDGVLPDKVLEVLEKTAAFLLV